MQTMLDASDTEANWLVLLAAGCLAGSATPATSAAG